MEKDAAAGMRDESDGRRLFSTRPRCCSFSFPRPTLCNSQCQIFNAAAALLSRGQRLQRGIRKNSLAFGNGENDFGFGHHISNSVICKTCRPKTRPLLNLSPRDTGAKKCALRHLMPSRRGEVASEEAVAASAFILRAWARSKSPATGSSAYSRSVQAFFPLSDVLIYLTLDWICRNVS